MRAFVIKTYPAKQISPRLGREPLGDLAMEIVGKIFIQKRYETTQLRVHIASREPLVTDLDLTKLQLSGGDIVSLSCHVGNMIDSAILANHLGEEFSESTVIMGGPNLNKFTSEQILRDFPGVDFALLGLAEYNLPHFLDAVRGNRNLSDVSGLYYIEDGELRSTPVDYPSLKREGSR